MRGVSSLRCRSVLNKFRSSASVVMVAATCVLALSACAHKAKKPLLAYEERPVGLRYSTGPGRLDRRRWGEAVDYFSEVERQHPYSEWARRSILMSAFAHYESNN